MNASSMLMMVLMAVMGIMVQTAPHIPAGTDPTGAHAQALIQHAAAEAAVRASSHYLGLVGPSGIIGPGIGTQFTGLIGPSGNIGPLGTGLCGPSGCVAGY